MPAPAVALGIAATILISVPLLVAGSLGAPTEDSCMAGFEANGQSAAVPASASAAGLDATQLAHAVTIISVGRRRQMPDQGIVIALATALQESRLRVYANDGTGELAADQRGIDSSLGLRHEAVGSDHGSLGMFQQQWPWWGSMTELMDPVTSAELFYEALERVPRWQSLPVTIAAQAVQKSAYPSAYADDEPLARRLLLKLGAGAAGVSVGCELASGGGVVLFPLPPDSGYVDRRNFGATGASWISRHTGTDFSVVCGTTVFAAHSGTVHIQTDQSWSGRWLVQVEVAPGRLTTWYAHLQAITVGEGDWVQAGEVVGAVGQEGNATGCHLHFEVHPQGGGIYEDPVDPSAWLAESVDVNLSGFAASANLAAARPPDHDQPSRRTQSP
jgi:murein DD-endopeptidase MepM/ murein hydrolase activator NlpD